MFCHKNDKAPLPAKATELYRFGKEKDMKGKDMIRFFYAA